VRKNWKGSRSVVFCNANETIKHLLFDCHHAKQIWRIIYLATGLSPPRSISHMFGNWLHILDDKIKKITMAGCRLCWAIWRCMNDIIFNKIKYSSFLHVIFRGGILASLLNAVAAWQHNKGFSKSDELGYRCHRSTDDEHKMKSS
jgi:hypothetical protein